MELDYDYIAHLVRETQKGDRDAFAELYTATYQSQYRFAYQYVKDVYLAQDILQEVYIVVLTNIKTLKNPRLFVSWLHQINFRICYDTAHKKYLQEEELHPDSLDESLGYSGTSTDHTVDPEKHILDMDMQEHIKEKILSLPPHLSQPIIMRYYNDMSIDDIADAMDCSKSTVKRHLAKARKLLEQKLGMKKGGINFEEK